ncbi:MAG: site-2 protease family protein [Candidatus Paceibacterota bacterium]
MSVVVHEVSHGLAAYYFGDETARSQGRLTFNPIKHLDLFGSIILPALLILSNAGFVLGWAKPVPYNSRNLNNQKYGPSIVVAAGIFANFFLAIVFGLLIRFAPVLGLATSSCDVTNPFIYISSLIVVVNLLLGVFNLLPIPPLDGSQLLFQALPYRFRVVREFLESYSVFILFFFIIFLWDYIIPIIGFLFKVIVGTICV